MWISALGWCKNLKLFLQFLSNGRPNQRSICLNKYFQLKKINNPLKSIVFSKFGNEKMASNKPYVCNFLYVFKLQIKLQTQIFHPWVQNQHCRMIIGSMLYFWSFFTAFWELLVGIYSIICRHWHIGIGRNWHILYSYVCIRYMQIICILKWIFTFKYLLLGSLT